ncbi:preprotein translocase subunit Tim44 [Vibrio breoganii]|uniref:Tim44 domain-containing protein n=1 Tax=Vibrio breoganii TaxID=553239 RepID=UPI000C8544E2|nr:Tim44 domain-containing protein [Vibrio breoganii]PMO61492.1 preprotein translocase subunit Tim44 [Vibrio breoganii]
MKRIFSIMAVLLVSVSMVYAPVSEAKRFGGGKSFGKSFKTAPAPKAQPTNTNSLNNKGTQTSRKGGLMGGLMGGLLAGGLLAAFFGGAFEGIQFMDILIMGLIAFFAFKFLRGMLGSKAGSMNQQRPAYSNGPQGNTQFRQEAEPQPFSQPAPGTGFGSTAQSDVPHNYPPGFDHAAFVNGSREHYRILQGAWNHNELETIREYVSASLFDDLKSERASLQGEQHTDVMFVDAEIVRADYDASKAQLSLQFSGRYRDTIEGVEEDINDIWHLERDLTEQNAPWLIVGIQAN